MKKGGERERYGRERDGGTSRLHYLDEGGRGGERYEGKGMEGKGMEEQVGYIT